MNKNKTRKGFTLVEIAVTLVIVGIIISIAIGMIRGVSGALLHSQWQSAMNDSYSTLIEYGASHGYLPKDSATWEALNVGIVDDFKYGGRIGYRLIATDLADKTFIQGGKICDTFEDNISAPVVAELYEDNASSIVRPDKLATRPITLAELKNVFECGTMNLLEVVEPAFIKSDAGHYFGATVVARGGKPIDNDSYFWCVEVAGEDYKIPLVSTCSIGELSGDDVLDAFNSILPSDGKVSKSCDNSTTSLWSKSKNRNFVFQTGDARIYMGSSVFPMKVFVRDIRGRTASRKIAITHSGWPASVPPPVGCPW